MYGYLDYKSSSDSWKILKENPKDYYLLDRTYWITRMYMNFSIC